MDCTSVSELQANLFNTIADPFIVIADDGTYLEVLGGAERTLYDEPTQLKGRNIHDFMESNFARFFMGQVAKTLETNQLNTFEYQLATDTVRGIPKNGPGGMQWFEARLYPLKELWQGKRAVTAMLINISERKMMQQRLRELSYQDPLTQAANRRYFFEYLDSVLNPLSEKREELAVLIMDVDHFKKINDNHGHLAGDALLKELVAVVRALLGPGALIARFGGDEFIVLLHPADIESAMRAAESIREKVCSYRFPYENLTIPMTVSLGVADATVFDTDSASIVARADKALYRAKDTGRNQVCRG